MFSNTAAIMDQPALRNELNARLADPATAAAMITRISAMVQTCRACLHEDGPAETIQAKEEEEYSATYYQGLADFSP